MLDPLSCLSFPILWVFSLRRQRHRFPLRLDSGGPLYQDRQRTHITDTFRVLRAHVKQLPP